MTFEKLFNDPSKRVATVPTAAALPVATTVPIGSERVTADTGDLYIADGTAWNLIGGSSSGVASWNGLSGVVSADTDDLPEGAGNLYCTAANIATELALNNNAWVVTDGSSNLTDLGGWGYNSLNGATVLLTATPNGSSGNFFSHSLNLNVQPAGNSPDQQYTGLNVAIDLDPLSSGFDIGTNGSAANVLNISLNHSGTSDVGSLNYLLLNATLGNGTDPITVEGMTFISGFMNYAANVTLENGLQGYTFGPNINASAILGTNFYCHAFADFSQHNVAIPSGSYVQPFKTSSTYAEISSGATFSGLDMSNQVTVLDGFYTAANLSPNIAGGTGTFFGLNVTPTLTSIGSASLANLSTSNVSASGTVYALQLQADDPSHRAISSNGRTDINAGVTLASSLGQLSMHQFGGGIVVPDATTITGTDVIFDNLAVTFDLGDATSDYTGSGLVDLTNVGFVGQIGGDGDANGLNFLLVGFSAVHNGTIDAVHLIKTAGIPGGGSGTITDLIGYGFYLPFGAVATNSWGFLINEASAENYIAGSLAIGDMATKKVANSSVALEIDSSTKCFLNARMTTTERDAMTAVNGMQIYNETTDKLQAYAAGAWVDLH